MIYPKNRSGLLSLTQFKEETEFRSDGTKKVIRPARLSLARVSVLRGDGSQKGVPFIDDHIHTSETIVDYLTEFSGIECEISLDQMEEYITDQRWCSRRPRPCAFPIHTDPVESGLQEASSPG